MIGLIGDGNGNIFVPDRPGYVYVRVQGDNTKLKQAFNDDKQIIPVYNLPVTVGYDLIADPIKQIFRILSAYEVKE